MSRITKEATALEVSHLESEVCTQQHCFHAFDTLYCSLTGEESLSPQFTNDKYPLFVTWNTCSPKSNRPPRLRGCIGTFEPQPVHDGLTEYALISAFRDSRFRRIERGELENLECVVSLLTDFEDAGSYLDWIVGVHGIHISFPHPSLLATSPSGVPSPLSSSANLPSTRLTSKRTLTATYLPDVMAEQGWDKLDAIDSAIQKAGWNGPVTEDLRRSIKLRRYQSKKSQANWASFKEWREQSTGKVVAL